MSPPRVLACIWPHPAPQADHFDACSSVQELSRRDTSQVLLLSEPSFAEFQQQVRDTQPQVVYLCGPTSWQDDKQAGSVGQIPWREGPQTADALAQACTGAECVYLDAPASDASTLGGKVQAVGVQSCISWPASQPLPATLAAQISHTFFSCLLVLRASVPEAYAMARHVAQAHWVTLGPGDGYVSPALPELRSPLPAALPDNTSITPPVVTGHPAGASLADAVPGWSDLRLLAPRAELKLLLAGALSLLDGNKLSFLGEALRALLVLEVRSLTLGDVQVCDRVPANLPLGCGAVRCEAHTLNGVTVSVVLGGQASVLSDRQLVEHALRMTLVADALSLQFRLPPPELRQAVQRSTQAIAGGAPVMDALVLTSVWAVGVLRSLSQDKAFTPMISLSLAAVGGTATAAVTPVDAQRLKMIATGTGPAENPRVAIEGPGGYLSVDNAVPGAGGGVQNHSSMEGITAGA